MERNVIETWTIIIVHGFQPESEISNFGKSGYHVKCEIIGEYNDAHFSFLAPSRRSNRSIKKIPQFQSIP